MTKDYKQADSVYTGLLADGDSSFLNLKYAGAARYMSGHALDGVELLEKAYEIDSTDVETVMLYGASLGKTYDRKRAYELFDLAETNMQPKKFLVNMLTTEVMPWKGTAVGPKRKSCIMPHGRKTQPSCTSCIRSVHNTGMSIRDSFSRRKNCKRRFSVDTLT